MTRLDTILVLSTTVLFCGCGGGSGPAPKSLAPASSATQAPPPKSGNWQFTVASTIPGKPPLTFAGSLNLSGTAASSGLQSSGALHIDGSDCFNRLTTIGFTSTANGSSTSLTSAPVDGQVVTLTGNFVGATFNGTYRVGGGCAGGNQGTLTGSNIDNIRNALSGTFTNSTQKTFNLIANINQSDSANSDGSFPISGTATFDTPCFSAGTIQPGTFPSGSFILGDTVALEVETGKGVLTFLGNLSESGSGEVDGNYTLSGAGCDDSGIAVLHVKGAWDY
jgi:hypothetical protein